MKITSFLIGAVLLLAAVTTQAQSPIFTATNYDAGVSYGRNFSKGYNINSLHLIYNLQQNVGIVVFGDVVYNSHVSQFFSGGGGFSLNTGPIQPLLWTRIPYIQAATVDLFNMSLVANPYHGSGVMAYKNITGGGVPLYDIGNGFVLDASVEYEIMTDSGPFDGGYWLMTASVSSNWGVGKPIAFRARANRMARGFLRKIGAIEY